MADPSLHPPPLPPSVEELIEKICADQQRPPPEPHARSMLASLGEEEALRILRDMSRTSIRNFTALLIHMIKNARRDSPEKTPTRSSASSSPRLSPQTRTPPPTSSPTRFMPSPAASHSPNFQPVRATRGGSNPVLVALGELEFRKAFLILAYIGEKKLDDDDIVSANEIRMWKDLPMGKFEPEVWRCLGRKYIKEEERRKSLDWDSGKPMLYHCHVIPDGSYIFKGPFICPTGTHLQRVLGDDNVLIVKFSEEVTDNGSLDISLKNSYDVYKQIAREGILVGLRIYRFFVFKDGGKAEKKKCPTASPVKCFFVRTESSASFDEKRPYKLRGRSIYEARSMFMHAHTVSSVSSHMARFSLILSNSIKSGIDLSTVDIQEIEDVPCRDDNGDVVCDKDGKIRIHTDGTGFISKDLALTVLGDLYKESAKNGKFEGKFSEPRQRGSHFAEPPLLIQFRLFKDGCAVKGTFLVNQKLPPRTLQIRPSMIKVKRDELLDTQTENSLEIVLTSKQPKRTNLSRNLIALLSYGGVPDKYFLDLVTNTLEDAKVAFSNKRSALNVAINHGEMDDNCVARMILCGVPLDEPFIQYRLSQLVKEEKKGLKGGMIPVPECYYLMGTADPTGILQRDEVCIVLDKGQVSGEVLVYRNPGLHIGDIHVLKATYVEALEEFIGNAKYAIFFPINGPRNVGDEIAGGDFDGDLYFVSRNPQLLKYFTASECWTSASSTPQVCNIKPSDLSPKELEDELFELFLTTRFQPSYTISQAADCWRAFMDRLLTLGDESGDEKKILKEKLLKLIDIYYDALDAPKKGGVKIEVPKQLQAAMFPHYMERPNSYKSTSILGQIFETVKSYEAEEVEVKEIHKLPCFNVEVSDACYNLWEERYNDYRSEMHAALSIEKDKNNNDAGEIIRKYKQMLYSASEFEESPRSMEEIFDEALAIYNVAYNHAQRTGYVSYCSFPWRVAGRALCKLHARKQEEKPVDCLPSVLREILN